MGMFGVSEILLNMEDMGQREIFTTKVKGIWPNRKDLRDSTMPILRGSLLGFALGLLPGAGNVTASFISYGMERRLSRYPEKFGTGVI